MLNVDLRQTIPDVITLGSDIDSGDIPLLELEKFIIMGIPEPLELRDKMIYLPGIIP